MVNHVFVSYGRHDSRYVLRLVEHLRGAGIPVWMDAGLDYGDRWDEVVREQVDACAAVVVVMTRHAEGSVWVRREIARAERRGLPILPLLLEGEPIFTLGDLHYEDVRGGRMPTDRYLQRLRRLSSRSERMSETAAVGSGPGLDGGPPADQGRSSSGSSRGLSFLEPRWDGSRNRAGSAGLVEEICVSPDGRFVVSGGGAAPLGLWDVRNALVGTCEPFAAVVTGLGCLRAGRSLAAGGLDGSVAVIDLEAGTTVTTLVEGVSGQPIGDLAVMSLATDLDRVIAVGNLGRGVRLWVVDSVTDPVKIPTWGAWPRVALSPATGTLAIGDGSRTLSLHDVPSGAERLERTCEGLPVELKYSPSGEMLAVALKRRGIELRHGSTLDGIGRLAVDVGDAVGLDFSPDGRHLACTTATGVLIWDMATRTEFVELDLGSPTLSIAWAGDNSVLAVGVADSTAVVPICTRAAI